MTDINTVTLVGRLTRDAELKYTSGGTGVSKFTLAVNRSKKVNGAWQDDANFFDCSIFGKSAESLNQYLIKGTQVAVTGSLEQQRWESDGQKRSKIVVVVNNLQLISKKESSKREEDIPF